jgi:hypothetical protein
MYQDSLVPAPELAFLVPSAIPAFRPNTQTNQTPLGTPVFSPVRSSYFSFGPTTPKCSQVVHQLSGDAHMEEINSILYDMHGTAHVILIAALFVILLIVH